jgi:quinoprotein glucose dehydrogenase
VLAIADVLLSLLGAAIALVGLMSPSESAFHFLSGAGLILSGTLVARGHRAGAWIYMAVFAITVTWSLRNIEVGGSSLAMRLVGPSLLLAILALLMPALRGWHPRKTGSVFATLLIGTIGLGISSAAGGPLAGFTATVAHLLDVQKDGVLS